ncbi:endolytic transglycosylase MltG [bacterium]|nr:MAG: endolytic transglycosylase MltG [bacterium]RKZ14442.1 MAG: endolytic transglycosylase MltG [bacterium]
MRARLAVAVLAIGLIGFGAWSAVFAPYGSGTTVPAQFRVREGASLQQVARQLAEEDLIRNALALRVWARIKSQERAVRAGEYELARGQSMAATLQALVAGPLLTHAVTLPEGWTRRQTVSGLAKGLELDATMLDSLSLQPPDDWRRQLGLDAVQSLEGYLFPETYRFARGVRAGTVLHTLVDAFTRTFDDSMRTRADEIGMSVHQVVTLASIVEAEAVLDRERPRVAAVYLNRIERGWKLEADPTVAYALDKIGDRLSYRDLEVDSAYNTYRNTGLPPGPINSPGLSSLRAVLWPEPGFQAMYFVADGEGGHRFSRTWQEHQAAVREYRKLQRTRRGGG